MSVTILVVTAASVVGCGTSRHGPPGRGFSRPLGDLRNNKLGKVDASKRSACLRQDGVALLNLRTNTNRATGKGGIAPQRSGSKTMQAKLTDALKMCHGDLPMRSTNR